MRSVLTDPGQTAFTVMRCGARSIADACVNPITANFDVVYAAVFARARFDASEPMLMIRPPRPLSIITGATYLVTRNGAVVLIARKRCQTSSLSSVTGARSRPMIARALF